MAKISLKISCLNRVCLIMIKAYICDTELIILYYNFITYFHIKKMCILQHF